MNDRERHDDSDDSYLWDGSGPPDPDVARLEEVLGTLRHRGTPPLLPSREPAPSRPIPRVSARWLAAAAAIVLIPAIAWVLIRAGGSSWTVLAISGTPAVEGRGLATDGQLSRGDWLVTDATSRARISVGTIGRVEVEPNTRLQLVTASSHEHRMTLDRGTIHARIWAPPEFFYVNTESAVAVDLGCAYTLHVADNGSGVIRVTNGWVGFDRDGRRTFVPEGAVCTIAPRSGPGTPWYEDAPSGYGQALALLDSGVQDGADRAAALDLVLSTARRRDALTLWHLLTRGSRDERVRAYDRLAALVPPPSESTRDRVLAGDPEALNNWWNRLGIDTSRWWKVFKKFPR
jgi:hypothetical protein